MNPNDVPASATAPESQADLMSPLLQGPARAAEDGMQQSLPGVVIGELLALIDESQTPLVCFEGPQGPLSVRARSTIDLHGANIGRGVVLVFEQGDAQRPIVIGLLHDGADWPVDERPAQVQVDVDGEHLLVSAKQQLVLRCGKASITLTKAGKVLIEGSYLLSRSTGVNRVKGGSVQLN